MARWTCSSISVFSCSGKPRAGSPVLSRWMTCLSLLAVLFLMQPGSLWMFFAAKAQCWLTFNMLFTRTSVPFLQSCCIAVCWLPTCTGAWPYFLPGCRTWHFPLLNFMRLMLVHFSSVAGSLWSGVSTTPPGFVSPANSLRVQSDPSSRSLMEVFTRLDEYQRWSTLPVEWLEAVLHTTNGNFLNLAVPATFQSTSLSICLVYSSSVHQQGFYGIQC